VNERTNVRTMLQALSALLIGLALPAIALGLFILFWSWLVPVQPAPNLNEGLLLGHLVGSLLFGVGCLSFFGGVVIVLALRKIRPPDENASDHWLRRHKRLW
jgi:hypothetical protein